MNQDHKINLHWQYESIFLGKICIGKIQQSLYKDTYECLYYKSFHASELLIDGIATESAAHTALEQFIRDQMKTPS